MQDGNTRCGICGNTRIYAADQVAMMPTLRQVPVHTRDRSRAILVLILGAAVLVEGAIQVFLPIDQNLIVLGFFMMAVGAVILLATTGVFSGTPYRSRILNRADQELKRRERRKYAD